MPLTRVTISGADESVDPEQLRLISQEYPFVEWGILFSPKRQGTMPRYPGPRWVDRLKLAAWRGKMNLSLHLCGLPARNIETGTFDAIPLHTANFQRVQINGFSEFKDLTRLRIIMHMRPGMEFILQAKDQGAIERAAAVSVGLPNVSSLYDGSGGLGIAPKGWPAPPATLKLGYAGGIGPDNVEGVIRQLNATPRPDYWIDMETRVRTADDRQFDLNLVKKVLHIAMLYAN